MTTPTCIHSPSGLCPDCQSEYDADPLAWLEYGDHLDGIANTRALEEELAARPAATDPYADDPTIPY